MINSLLLLTVLLVATPVLPASSDCRMFEVEVASVDTSGTLHPLFNFGQALPLGQSWSHDIAGEAGTLNVSITWDGIGSDRVPKIKLELKVRNGAATGTARLEKLVWDSLYGPEPFTASQGKPFLLAKAGAAFAVASVVPTRCGE
jgi:hypothetical protein